MEILKVTQEQAEWLERYPLTQEQIDHFIDIQPFGQRPDSPIIDWNPSKVARALYIGFEVEPTFKEGDYVINAHGTVGKIHSIENGVCFGKWLNSTQTNDGTYDMAIYIQDLVRHATEKEIEEVRQAKTISWWAMHDRDVWEIKEEDVLEYLGDFLEVNRPAVRYKDSIVVRFNVNEESIYEEDFDFVKEHFRVVCFAEDRKDI